MFGRRFESAQLHKMFPIFETIHYICTDLNKDSGMTIFRLIFLEEAKIFLQNLPVQAYKKILYNIDRIINGEKNSEIFKKLENSEIWEFRTIYNGISYLLFAFWDTHTESIIIATHGIIKKTQKTPKKEIKKAEAIMRHYFELKKS